MPARLVIHLPDAAALVRFVEPDGATTLGRAPECELVLEHASVSRRHAELAHAGDHWRLRDLGSKNGLRIGGARVMEGRIEPGQWFSVGDVFCEFDEVAPGQAAAAAERAQRRRQDSRAWTQRIEAAKSRDEMLAGLIAAIVELAECRRGFLLAGNPVQGLRVRACFHATPEELSADRFQGSSGAIERSIRERRPVFLSNASDQAWLRGRASVIAGGIRALAAVPLVHEGRLLGVAYADSDEHGKLFTELDAELLEAFAQHAALALTVGGLADDLHQLESWLSVAPDGSARRAGEAPAWAMLRPEREEG